MGQKQAQTVAGAGQTADAQKEILWQRQPIGTENDAAGQPALRSYIYQKIKKSPGRRKILQETSYLMFSE